MALPIVKTKEDILTVIKQNRRWRRRQRVLALRVCKKQLMVLGMRHDITMQETQAIRRKLIPLLNREAELLKKETPKQEPLENLPEVTDAAKKFAVENKVDLSKVTYTNRITIRDVREYVNPTS